MHKCGKCGQTGHNSRTCLSNLSAAKPVKTAGKRICSVCGEAGHNARTCAKAGKEPKAAKPKKIEHNRRCHWCGLRGHTARNCDLQKKQIAQVKNFHEKYQLSLRNKLNEIGFNSGALIQFTSHFNLSYITDHESNIIDLFQQHFDMTEFDANRNKFYTEFRDPLRTLELNVLAIVKDINLNKVQSPYEAANNSIRNWTSLEYVGLEINSSGKSFENFQVFYGKYARLSDFDGFIRSINKSLAQVTLANIKNPQSRYVEPVYNVTNYSIPPFISTDADGRDYVQGRNFDSITKFVEILNPSDEKVSTQLGESFEKEFVNWFDGNFIRNSYINRGLKYRRLVGHCRHYNMPSLPEPDLGW